MAFVNEPMGEAGVKLIKSLNLPAHSGAGHRNYNDFCTDRPEDKWTIDHERNLQFFVMGGIGRWDREQPPLTCCLIWKGLPIRIETYSRNKGNNTVGIQENWEIDKILVPSELKDVPEEEIIETIKEAFITYAHRRERNIEFVKFPMMPKIKYLYKVGEIQ